MSQTAARGRGRLELRNVQPAPQADTEPLGTLTVEAAFDPALVTIDDGSGTITPNPVAEDQQVTFEVTISNANDRDAQFDFAFVDGAGVTWVAQNSNVIAAGATATVFSLSVVPQNINIAPGDYAISGEMFNVIESTTAGAALDVPGLRTARGRVVAAGAGGGVAAAVLASLIGA